MKKSKTIFTFCLLPLLLNSCKQGDDSVITITWWNNYKVPTTDAEKADKKTYALYYYAENVIDDFEKKHPNVKIETKYFYSYSTINDEVKAGKNTGNIPTISLGYPDYVQNYLNEGIPLVNVNEFINDKDKGFGKEATSTATFKDDDSSTNYIDNSSTLESDINERYMNLEKSMYKSNELYSLPYSKSGEVLFTNSTVFNKEGSGEAGTTSKSSFGNYFYNPPVSIDSKTKYQLNDNYTFLDLINIAKQIQIDYPNIYTMENGVPTQEYIDTTSGHGKIFKAVPFIYDSADNLFVTLCQQLNIDYINPNGKNSTEKILFNNDEAKKVVKQLKKWSDEGLFATRDQLNFTDNKFTTHQYGTTYFEEGKTMMIILSTPNVQYFAENGYTSSVYKIPQFTRSSFNLDDSKSEKYSVISQGPSLIFFKNKDSRVDRAAFEFYKELTSTDNNANLSLATEYFPIRKSSYENDAIKEMISKGKEVSPSITVSSSINDKQNALYSKVYDYNLEYTDNNSYFMTQATTYSSTVRSCIKEMMTTILSNTEAKTDKEIDELINNSFKSAYDKIMITENID